MINHMYKKLLSILLSTALVFGFFAGTGFQTTADAAAQDQPDILLQRNAEWKYFDQGQDLTTVWRATYDDSSWASGLAPFGYKDNGSGIATAEFGPLNTVVDYGADKKLQTPHDLLPHESSGQQGSNRRLWTDSRNVWH